MSWSTIAHEGSFDFRTARDEVEVAVGIPIYEGRRALRGRGHAVERVIVPGPGHIERLTGEANILKVAHPSVPRPDGEVQIACGGRVLSRTPPTGTDAVRAYRRRRDLTT